MPTRCSRVDFPAPEGPMMEMNSPSLMLRSIRRRTKVLVGPCSKYFSTFRKLIMTTHLVITHIGMPQRIYLGRRFRVRETTRPKRRTAAERGAPARHIEIRQEC